jgi:hypothetical protein
MREDIDRYGDYRFPPCSHREDGPSLEDPQDPIENDYDLYEDFYGSKMYHCKLNNLLRARKQ